MMSDAFCWCLLYRDHTVDETDNLLNHPVVSEALSRKPDHPLPKPAKHKSTPNLQSAAAEIPHRPTTTNNSRGSKKPTSMNSRPASSKPTSKVCDM